MVCKVYQIAHKRQRLYSILHLLNFIFTRQTKTHYILKLARKKMKSSQTVQPNTSEGISPIQPFGCARCLGVLFETSQELITHFRLKHGIKPETFSAEKRKRFYDSFNQPDTENATKPAVRSSSLLVPAGNTLIFPLIMIFID